MSPSSRLNHLKYLTTLLFFLDKKSSVHSLNILNRAIQTSSEVEVAISSCLYDGFGLYLTQMGHIVKTDYEKGSNGTGQKLP